MSYPECDVVYTITDGDEEVSLVRVQTESIMSATEQGFADFRFAPHALDVPIRAVSDFYFNENYSINISEGNTNDMARESRKLWRLLRKAWLFSFRSRFNKPVVIIAKARGETNERYATVIRSPMVSGANPIFDPAFEQASIMQDVGIQIERMVWVDQKQDELGTAIELDETNGPADPSIVHVCNHYDNHAIDTVKLDDGGAYTDVAGVAAFNIFPAAALTNDRIYFGSDEPFYHIMGYIGTAGVYTATTFAWEYYNGGWTALTLGDEFTLYPDADPFNAIGHWAFNWKGADDWQKTTIDGDNKFWIRCVVTMGGVWTTAPANSTYAIYNQRTPELRIPSDSIEGDAPPFVLMRAFSPYGGDEDVYFSNISRIIMGSKSRNLSSFSSHLNCGGDGLPAGWAVSYGDDTASEASEIAPGGDRAACDFSTETAMVMRVRFTGTDMLKYYVGEYRPFLRATQVGGDAGDLRVKLRVSIDSTEVYATSFETPNIDMAGVDASGGDLEVIDLLPQGILRIPFADYMNNDDLTGADLIFEIHVEQASGTPTWEGYDLILIPVDEWSAELDDPISNIDVGSSALRGLKGIDFDGGVLSNRTIVFLRDSTLAYVWTAETWSRHGLPMRLNPDNDHRIYFLIMHYPEGEDWGDPPLCARCGCDLFIELYLHNAYFYLRGDQ